MKAVGTAIGLDETSSTVRMSQYENGARTPRPELLRALAQTLNVRPERIAPSPEDPIDAVIEFFLWMDKESTETIYEGNARLSAFLSQYWRQKAKLARGEISRDEFIEWKLKYIPIRSLSDNPENCSSETTEA